MLQVGQGPTPSSSQAGRKYATERFVEIVRRGVMSPVDPKTVPEVARLGGTSRSPFSVLCKTLGIVPQDARDFIRLFRALVRTGGNVNEPHDVLRIAEPKTLQGLLRRAGVPYPLELSPLEFIERQRLVRNPHVLEALKISGGDMPG